MQSRQDFPNAAKLHSQAGPGTFVATAGIAKRACPSTQASTCKAVSAQWRHGIRSTMNAAQRFRQSLSVVMSDIVHGFMEITHNSFALVGLAVIFFGLTFGLQPDLRQAGQLQLMEWLQDHQDTLTSLVTGTATDRVTAMNPKDLPKPQAAVTQWLGRKYNIAQEPMAALVAESFAAGAKAKIDPLLILAVMAVESGFNPIAQSPMGAQGLMQVMTQVHSEKYTRFGGTLAAFDALSNVRVGVKVLEECIARAGSPEGGLRLYVGAGNLEDDGGYAAKVLAEQARLQAVFSGRPVPVLVPLPEVKPLALQPDGTLGFGSLGGAQQEL